MQTKKRAKSVSFGKKTIKKEPELTKVQVVEEVEEPKEPKRSKAVADEVVDEVIDAEEKAKEINSPDDDRDTAAEIKQKIEEKLHPKPDDDLPEDVDLTTEEPVEPDEKQTDEPEEAPVEEKKSAFGTFTDDYDGSRKKNNNLRFFLVVLFITFFVGLLLIQGVYYMTTQKTMLPSNINNLIPQEPTAAPTVAPSPTDVPVDLSTYNIKVLNGSGTTGEAAKVRTLLEEAGFTVEEVGNADTSDYENTVIAAKKGVAEGYLKELIKVLAESYKVDSEVADLSEDETLDVSITIGSSTAE